MKIQLLSAAQIYAESLNRGIRSTMGYTTQNKLKPNDWVAIHTKKEDDGSKHANPMFVVRGADILNDILWPDVVDYSKRLGCIIGIAQVESVTAGAGDDFGDLIRFKKPMALRTPIAYRGNSFLIPLPADVVDNILEQVTAN